MQLSKEFDVTATRVRACEVLAEDATLTSLFPDTKTEIVARTARRRTAKSLYKLLGQAGAAPGVNELAPGAAYVNASDGVRLYAEAHGVGEPVVFSPGYCQTHENFRPQVAPFVAAGFRVVLWDYRGHGRSDAPENPGAYSMAQV